jgi:uncharacterized membrane protein YphA (DoxX/SURF4 family)
MESLGSGFERINPYAPSILRIGMAIVFLWFSINQLINPLDWTGFVPENLSRAFDPVKLVYLNAGFEMAFASLLLLGIWTRISSVLLALHLLAIIISLGYNQIAVRDAGLAIATLTVAVNGPDKLCLIKKKQKFS